MDVITGPHILCALPPTKAQPANECILCKTIQAETVFIEGGGGGGGGNSLCPLWKLLGVLK